MGAFLGHATSASQSGAAPPSQSGTPSLIPVTLRTTHKAEDQKIKAMMIQNEAVASAAPVR
jgi:hypothetical protein